MYSHTDESLTLNEAELRATLRGPIQEALSEHPDYCTVCIIVVSEAQRRLGQALSREISKELGEKCLRQADRVIFIAPNIGIQLGTIKLFDNYLTVEAYKRRHHA